MRNWRIVQFVLASGTWGGCGLVASFMFFVVGAYEHYSNRSVPAFMWILCGMVLFCFGAYKAWSAERDALNKQSELLDSHLPKVKLSTLGCTHIYFLPDDRHVFIVAIVLGNGGAPTAVDRWSATYEIGDSVEEMQSFSIPSNGLEIQLKKEVKIFHQKEMIQSILGGNRIERRQVIPARILFTVPGNRSAQAFSCAYKIRIKCRDYDGNEISALYAPSAIFDDVHKGFSHEEPPVSRILGEE